MASRFQQRALLRKVVYIALIVVLLSVSLWHRTYIVIPQGYNLQLREEARGEVELTSSAVRLITTGGRGFATCWLWLGAIEKQKKHEWNEMELLVRSITKLQPYFVSPWLFQSWNLSFNVAVEFDRVKDKYFYITRGIELLSEGERRNQGGEFLSPGESKRLRFPGNPEMRFHLGFTYQLKIGQGDEQDDLRCLYDLSCIDPLERDPDTLWAAGAQGREVDMVKFEQFCKKHPRLVRRLRETELRCDSPRLVVDFLRDNRDVPTRYEKSTQAPGSENKSPLKPLTERFPILPPPSPEVLSQHALKDRDKIDDIPGGEDFDVFGAGRLWYEYAQEPLPPPNPNPGVNDQEFNRTHYNPLLHRLPKMAHHIFRAYPARTQAFHAESLQKEGWFDADGWVIKNWFDRAPSFRASGVRIGTDSKYHSYLAWNKAHRMYVDYGKKNGLYLAPEDDLALRIKARPFLKVHGMEVGEAPEEMPARDREAGLEKSFEAAKKLKYNLFYRGLTNYDTYLSETGAERLEEAKDLRKAFFQAERLRRAEAAPEQALATYEATIPKWLGFLLANLNYARISEVQEETYEMQMRYLRLLQGQRDTQLKPLVTGMAQLALVLPVPLHLAPTYADQQATIIPIRAVRGPFERIYLFDRPDLDQFREVLFELTQVGGSRVAASPLLKELLSRTLVVNRARADEERRRAMGWRPLIGDDIIRQVRLRMGISRPPQAEPPTAPNNPQARKKK